MNSHLENFRQLIDGGPETGDEDSRNRSDKRGVYAVIEDETDAFAQPVVDQVRCEKTFCGFDPELTRSSPPGQLERSHVATLVEACRDHSASAMADHAMVEAVRLGNVCPDGGDPAHEVFLGSARREPRALEARHHVPAKCQESPVGRDHLSELIQVVRK